MTIAELFAALAAALTTAFTPSAFAVWSHAPDQTAVPAVWPQFASSFTGTDVNSSGQVAVEVVAVIAPQTSAAELAVIADAHDRLDTIRTAALDAAITGRTGTLGTVQIAGVDHTALIYQFTVARGLPC